MAPFKTLNYIVLRRRKLQFVIMLSHGPRKLLDASKTISKMTHNEILYKQQTMFWTSGLWWKKHMTWYECETKHEKQNNDNRKDEQSDDDKDEQSVGDQSKHCGNENGNDINAAKNSFLCKEVDSSIDLLTKQFKNALLNTDIQLSLLKMTYKSLQDHVKENCRSKNIDYTSIWRSTFPLVVVGVTDYSSILRLTELCLRFAVANTKYETGCPIWKEEKGIIGFILGRNYYPL